MVRTRRMMGLTQMPMQHNPALWDAPVCTTGITHCLVHARSTSDPSHRYCALEGAQRLIDSFMAVMFAITLCAVPRRMQGRRGCALNFNSRMFQWTSTFYLAVQLLLPCVAELPQDLQTVRPKQLRLLNTVLPLDLRRKYAKAWGEPMMESEELRQDSKVISFTAKIDEPLSVMLNWELEQLCSACSSIELLIQDLEYPVAGYYLKDIPVQTRSLRLDNSNVQQFKLEKFHLTDEDIPDPLQFVEGHKLTFYLFVNLAGQGEEGPLGRQVNPKELNVIGKCGPPFDVLLCSYFATSGACATEPAADRSVRVTWRRPSEVGNGASNVPVPLLFYQIQVAPQVDWNSPHTRTINMNVSSGNEFQNNLFVQVSDLTKGDLVVVRVRALTFVGPGTWSNSSSSLKVISYPEPPIISRGSSSALQESSTGEPFMEMHWIAPADTGDYQNDSIPISEYQIQFSNVSSFSTEYTASQTLVQDFDFRWNVQSFGRQFDLGTAYFARIRCRNVIGYSQYSTTKTIYFVHRPSMPLNVRAMAFKPLAVNISWDEPTSRGANDGVFVPMLGYELVISVGDSNSGMPSENGKSVTILKTRTSLRFTDSGVRKESQILENLSKGMVYYVYIRAQNNAFELDGNGDWSESALTRCADGNLLRPTACGVAKITALDAPTPPLNFSLRSVGNSQVTVSWGLPTDTGTGSNTFPLLRYDLQYFEDDAETETLVEEQIGHASSSFTTPQLKLGRMYSGRLRSVNDAEKSNWTKYSQARALLLPDAPGRVEAKNDGNLSFTVEWTRPVQTGLGLGKEWTMISYEFKVDSSCDDDRQLDLPENQTSILVTDVVEGCKYTFRVRGQNEAGYGDFQTSSEVRGLSLAHPVRNFRAIVDLALRVKLEWDVPMNTGDGTSSTENIASYEIEVGLGLTFRANSSLVVRRYSVGNQELQWAVPLLELGESYSFRIRVLNLAGIGVAEYQSAVPIIPPLLNVSISPSSNISGNDISLHLDLTLSSDMDVKDQIVVTFPKYFTLQSARAVPSEDIGEVTTSGGTGRNLCGYRCIPSIEDVFISRNGGGKILSAGSRVTLILEGIINRRWEGVTGAFQVRTVDTRGNYTRDQDLNVSGFLIVPGSFEHPTATLDKTNTGDIANLTFTLRSLRNPVPPNAIFAVTIARDMITEGITNMTIFFQGINEILNISQDESTIVGSRMSGVHIPANSTFELRIASIQNRITRGQSGTFAVKMLTSFRATMDASPEVGSLTISAGPLVDGKLLLDEYRALAKTRYVFTFKLGSVGLPLKSRVDINFPNEIMINEATFDDQNKTGVTGTFIMSTQNQVLSIERNWGEKVPPYTVITLPFAPIQNFYSGAVGNFTIRTVSSENGIVMEEMLNVSLSTQDFIPGQLIVDDFFLSEYKTGSAVTMIWKLTTTGPFNLGGIHGGKFVFILPPGFEWRSESTLSSDKPLVIDATSGVMSFDCENRTWLKCQTLTVSLPNGNEGGELPSSTTVTMTMTGIRNTAIESSCVFSISTQSTQGRIGDVNVGTEVIITPSQVNVFFIPSPPFANMTGSYEIIVTGFNVLPPDCKFVFSFPDAVLFSGDVVVSTDVTGHIATYAMPKSIEDRGASSGNSSMPGSITVVRNGELLPQDRRMRFTISPVRHRPDSGPTDGFAYSLQTLDGIEIESNISVPGLYLKYAKPEIHQISSTNGPRTGRVTITATGKNFGPVKENTRVGGDKRSISFGKTSSLLTQWVSDSTIVCVLAPGFPAAVVGMAITIEGQEVITSFSFDNQKLRSENAPYGSILTFIGSNLGTHNLSPKINLGLSLCESTVWTSDSCIVGKLSIGVGRTHPISISVAEALLSTFGLFSYESASIFEVVNTTRHIVYFLPEGDRFYGTKEVRGSSFGRSSMSHTVRFQSACESSIWISNTAINCIPSAGVQGSRTVVVTAGFSSGSKTESFSYPSVPSIEGHARSNTPSVGGVDVLIGARFLLKDDYSVSTRQGKTVCGSTVWMSWSSIVCKVPSGRGDELPLILTAGTLVGTVTQLMTYDWSQLSDVVDEHQRALNMPTSGHYHLSMSGVDFGHWSTSPSVRFALTAAEKTDWVSDSAVKAIVAAGVGASHGAYISILLMKHDARLTGCASYDAPQIVLDWHGDQASNNAKSGKYSSFENVPIRAAKATEFIGHHLGHSDHTLAMRVGASECQQTVWWSVTSLNCMTTLGFGRTHSLMATIAVLTATSSQLMSYDAHSAVSNRSISNAPAPMSKEIFLHGLSLEHYDISALVRVGFSSTQFTSWISMSSIMCKPLRGLGRSSQISLTLGQVVGSVSQAISYDHPGVSKVVSGMNRPSLSEPVYIEVFGSNLLQESSSASRIGPTASQNTFWITQTHLACKVAPGAGSKFGIVFSSGEQTGTATNSFTFDANSVYYISDTNFTRVNAPSKGGNLLTWTGSSFGPGVNSISARVGLSQCAATAWVSDSVLRCKDMSGVSGRGSAVIVSMLGGKQSSTNVFSYDGPKVSAFKEWSGSSRSSDILLNGRNFGVFDVTLQSIFGTAGCQTSTWLSDSSLGCSLRAGYAFKDIPLAAMKNVQICKKCKPNEVTIGCTDSSAGYCSACEACEPGFFRFQCLPGTSSMGVCKPCQTEGPVHQRQYKAVVGDYSTQCEMCTVCGGLNQDGTFYEKQKCTATSDTVCQPCEPCNNGLRIGCQGQNTGKCVVLEKGKIKTVLATVSQELLVKQIGESTFETIADNEISLTGDFSGTGVQIKKGTRIMLPSSDSSAFPSVSIAAVETTPDMQESARTNRMKSASNLTYFDVSGTKFDPPVRLQLRFENIGIADSSFVAHRWNPDNMTWTKLVSQISTTPEGLPVVHVETSHFSAYAVLEMTQLPTEKFPLVLVVVLPSAVFLILVSLGVLWCYKYRRSEEDDERPKNKLSKRTEPVGAQSFFLLTQQGPVKLEVSGQAPASPDRSEAALFLQATPPKTSQRTHGALRRDDSRVEDSTLQSPYKSLGRRDETGVEDSALQSPYKGLGLTDSGLGTLSPLSIPITPKLQFSDEGEAGDKQKAGAREHEDRWRRGNSDALGFPSTNLALLAQGFSTPAKVSAQASRAWSQSVVSTTGSQRLLNAEGSQNLEKSLAPLAMGFTTPMRVSADSNAWARYDGSRQESFAEVPGRLSAASPYLPRPESGDSYHQLLNSVKSDADFIDDDYFGYEQEQRPKGPSVDDVILSVGHDFTPRASSSQRRAAVSQQNDQDSPVRFASDLRYDYDETEFSIQPGVRRFVPGDHDQKTS